MGRIADSVTRTRMMAIVVGAMGIISFPLGTALGVFAIWLLCFEPAAKALVLPAYEWTLKTSHIFNLLDARGAVSVNERPMFIARVRNLAKRCAQAYVEKEKKSEARNSKPETISRSE